jgi:PRC-barrel domain
MIAAELRGGSRLSLDEALGWIGSRVDDLYGVGVGRLEDIWIDPGTGVPRWLLVKEGQFDGRATLIPFEDASAGGGRVWIPYDQDVVRRAPEVEPGSPLTQQLESSLRRHYAASAAAAVPHAGVPQPAPGGPGPGAGTAYSQQPAYQQQPPYQQPDAYSQPAARQQPYGHPGQAEYEAAARYPRIEEPAGHPPAPTDPARSPAQAYAAPPPADQVPPVPPRTVPPMRAAPPPPRPPAPVQRFPSPVPEPESPESRFERRPAPAPVEPFVPRSADPGPPRPAATESERGRRPGQPPLAAVEDDRGPHDSGAPSPVAGSGDQQEAVAMPVIHALDRPYRVEMQFEGELRISGELKGFRMTPVEEPPG